MKTVLLSLTAATVLLTFAATPSFATNGREAVNKCIDTKGCDWVVFDNGSISIITAQGGVINCKSAEAQCTTGIHRQTGMILPKTQIEPEMGGLGSTSGGTRQGYSGSAAPSGDRTTPPTTMSLH